MRPPKTRPGDTIALVAPAGPVPPDLVEKALPVLRGWGVEVHVGECVRAASTGYLSASDEQRAAEFTRAWLDPGVTCVLAARGGYGSQRMLDLVDWTALKAAGPKMFAGSSDVTALHGAVNVHLGLETLFSPMPATTLFDAVAAEHLRLSLFEPEGVRLIVSPTSSPLVPGTATGTLVGGNLALLTAGLGTPEQGSARESIVLLEDVTESLYRIDRMLTQLLRSGWLDGVRGFVLGSWKSCGEPGEIRALMLDRLGPLDVPIAWDFGVGHVPASPTIPLGARATLDTAAGALQILP
ncbi:S66 peptidase family protein [Amycolatopsis keratiniphila]|uniref:LD-carboxypeptidase n=1 Tax=Amycolatopsis keratiniphila subsp. keratiniphila TaxID=227715 RepID=A0A1W2LU40_9PSEU|nr:LD-carboxypeptidase [Amycolatopsis keratiniphila]ONF68875.1 LD-carboxypeptidase [Amycolatopsis keratiniphila subsp. keratiniphila]